MTEQEIINVLKENKAKGIAYLFLPEEVWNWIGENLNNPKLLYLATNGQWRLFSETDFDDYDNVVFALPDYYQVKEETKSEWVEFEIDNKGQYTVDFGEDYTECFYWYEWWLTLSHHLLNSDSVRFTAFGGWQYESNGYWLTTPHVIGKEGLLTTLINCDEDCKPAIPSKIRFWRESR